jgi:predicted dehydrogenase
MNEVKVAIIGFGGIARAHYAGYEVLKKENAPVKLVALCDINEKQFHEQVSINISTGDGTVDSKLHTYTSVDELIEKEDFDMADICLPSFLHKEYAIKLMRAGKHVLSEKPMALSTEQCEEMIKVSKETGKRFMIGQCLRFNNVYSYLKDCVEDGRFGKAKHVFMERLSAQPRWGFEQWFCNTERSGGCILDMHIHDVDMARYLFGEPNAVSCWTRDGDTLWAVENTRMYFDDVMVVINGSWDESRSCKFRSTFRVRFEKATVTNDERGFTVYPDEGEPYAVTVPSTNHMAEEIRFLADLILNPDKENVKNPPESACATVGVIEKLRESSAKNGEIIKM